MKIKSLFCGVLVAVALSGPAVALDLFSDALPQSTGQTCQSYAAALALAAKGDPAFPINTFGELREIEAEFRRLVTAYGNPYLHDNWPKAMSDLTGGKYTFSIDRNTTDIGDWMVRVRDATDIETDADLMIGQLTGTNFEMVLTSVYSLDGSDYSRIDGNGNRVGGHIIAVMGLLGSGIDSNTELVAFNSAIKGQGGSGVMCDDSFMATSTDLKYQAGVITTNDFELKPFTGYLFMKLVSK